MIKPGFWTKGFLGSHHVNPRLRPALLPNVANFVSRMELTRPEVLRVVRAYKAWDMGHGTAPKGLVPGCYSYHHSHLRITVGDS